MKDIYLMNRQTGELQPSESVIRNWYKTHGVLTSWITEWAETDMEVESSENITSQKIAGLFKGSVLNAR